MMAKSDSPHHQTVLNSLFKQSPRPSRAYLYDIEADPSEYASLNNIVQDRLAALFHLHGAVDMEPPLLMPVLDPEADKNQAVFIDRHGDIVALPNNILVPFARLAARGNIKRIKRFHITNVFRPNPVAGHPKVLKAAVFDIITPDLEYGPVAASAEIIAVASDCLDNFPNLAQNYDIHISHSKLVEIALNRVTVDARSSVTEILLQSKSTPAQKRALLLKKGLPRTTIDELEILSEVEEDIDDILARLEKASPTISALMQPAVKEIKSAIQYAQAANIKRPIYFHPLVLGSHHTHFKDGILVEVVRRHKHTDVLAAGGRYDSLITRFSQLKPKPEPICALGIQIAVEKITAALVAYQSASLKTLVKEERSFGFWSPRRCDVYVVSYQSGYLQDRLDVVSFLWQHNISADLMYESGLPEGDHESHLDICAREGILFTVYPRARNVRNLPAFKVKSILKGTEVDLSRQELVGWLQHQIADQKRLDATTSGAQNILDTASNFPVMKDTAVIPDVHLVLPDPKKQRKTVRQIFLDKAFEKAVAIKTSFQNGMPVLVVDLTPAQFEAMTRSSSWIVEEEAWKSLSALFQQSQMNYALTIREAAIKRKAEGHSYILLFAVREDRAQLLSI
jgi:translation initiation factor 2-alpha kinase 4